MWRELAPIAIAASVASGAAIGERLGPGATGLPLAVAAIAVVGLALVPRRAALAAGVVLAIALGAALMTRAVAGVDTVPFASYVARRDVVWFAGVVVGDGSARAFDAQAVVRVQRWAPADGRRPWQGTDRRVLVRSAANDGARLGLLRAGDRVVVAGRLRPLGGFDARLRWQHVVALMTRAQVERVAPPDDPLLRIADWLRARTLGGLRGVAPRDRALLGAFLLGDTRTLDPTTRDDFRAAGLSHLLVVSGANVAFALALVGPVRRRLPIGGRIALGVAVVVVFATMTRFEPSVLRASVMALVVMTASALGRTVSATRALAHAVTVLLVVDPFLLHSLGFWLSVGATFGIATLAAPLARRIPGAATVRAALAVAVAAQIGVLPVLVVSGAGLPWVAPAANLLAVPVAEPISVLALPVAFVAPDAGALAAPLLFAVTLLLGWVRFVAHLARRAPLLVAALALAFAVGVAAVERAVASRR